MLKSNLEFDIWIFVSVFVVFEYHETIYMHIFLN